MDYSKYKNPIENPAKPTRPANPKATASAKEHRAYADELDQWDKLMVKYQSDKDVWQHNEAIRYDAFKKDALEEAQLTGHEAAQRCWEYAWDKGHYAGFPEVMAQLYQIAEVVLGDNPTPIPPVPNPMREKVLARIAAIKKDHNGFDRANMRWKLMSFGVTTIASHPKYGKSEVATHISNVDFASLSDTDLLGVFEMIIRRMNVQM